MKYFNNFHVSTHIKAASETMRCKQPNVYHSPSSRIYEDEDIAVIDPFDSIEIQVCIQLIGIRHQRLWRQSVRDGIVVKKYLVWKVIRAAGPEIFKYKQTTKQLTTIMTIVTTIVCFQIDK